MGLNYENLDDNTRRYMLEEIEMDVSSGTLNFGRRLTGTGKQLYPALLREAASAHDGDWLAGKLRAGGCMSFRELRRKPSGGAGAVHTPRRGRDAAIVFAEGEFNRFYIRGVCRRAIEEGIPEVEVYRARRSRIQRGRSMALIGKRVEAERLLEDLRTSQGRRTKLGIPGGPNSGITVRLP